MKNIKNKKAFSMVEMLVSIIVASILILAIGAISGVSTNVYSGLMREAQIYNDVTYGFKLMQNKVRSAQGISIKNQTGSWAGQYLEVGEQGFGLYTNTNSRDFVYIEKLTNLAKREVILSVPNPSPNLSISFTPTTTPTQSFKVTVSGTKNNIPFTLSTTILRRAK
jgi:prepilin-type N-terminal cleavage/methylation domain-containing protein